VDEKLRKAMDEFMTRRLGDLGTDSPEMVTAAITQASRCMERLAGALAEEQRKLWTDLEDALALQIGEETRYYYKSGFEDAINFLLGWGGL
jgi:hypothetical protein